jgi:hypothetical protein
LAPEAAASVAESEIAKVNPNVLIIVSGLCRGYDLRAMVSRPGPTAALQRRRLVYSTHVYVFSWWWTHARTPLVLMIASILLVVWVVVAALVVVYWWDELPVVSTLLCFVSTKHPLTAYDALIALPPASFLPFACLWIVVASEKARLAMDVGCSTLAAEVEPWSIAGGVLVTLSGLAMLWVLGLWAVYGSTFWLDYLLCILGWVCLTCVAVIAMCCVSETYWMVCNELGRWRLDARKVPVWVGEFGTGVGDTSWYWGFLLRVLRDNDLDFAYWALNGRQWQEERGWDNEWFGLLNEAYSAVKDRGFTQSLFG